MSFNICDISVIYRKNRKNIYKEDIHYYICMQTSFIYIFYKLKRIHCIMSFFGTFLYRHDTSPEYYNAYLERLQRIIFLYVIYLVIVLLDYSRRNVNVLLHDESQ